MLRVKRKCVGRQLKGWESKGMEYKTEAVAVSALKGKGMSTRRWWCYWKGSGVTCQKSQLVLKGQSVTWSCMILCNDKRALGGSFLRLLSRN